MARFLVKASEFKNVCKAVNDRKLAELKKEIIEILKKQDEKDFKKAIDYFESQELHFTHLEKSLVSGKWIEKAGYGVGTVRIWKGKKYKKIAPGKWARVFDKEGRGTNIAIGKLIARVNKIDNAEDLLQFVMENKQRFIDEDGRELGILDKVRAAVDTRNEKLSGESSPYVYGVGENVNRAKNEMFSKKDKIKKEEADLHKVSRKLSQIPTTELKQEKARLERAVANKTRSKRDSLNNIIFRESNQEKLDAINKELEKRSQIKAEKTVEDKIKENPDYPFKPKTDKERAERVAFEKDRDDFIERMDKIRQENKMKDSKTAEKKEDDSKAYEGKLATQKQVDEATAISNKYEVSRNEMLKKPITTIQKYANSTVEDFEGGIDKFIEYMAEGRSEGVSMDEVGKEFAKLINHNVARKIWDDYESGALVPDEKEILKPKEESENKEEKKVVENNPKSIEGMEFVNKNKMHVLANFLANHDNVNMATAVIRLQAAYEKLGEEKFLAHFPKDVVERYRKEAGKEETKKESFTPISKDKMKSMSDDELKEYEAKLEKDLLSTSRTDPDYVEKYNHWREVHGENNDRFHQAIEDEARAEKQAEVDARSAKEKEINEKYNGYFENRKGLDKARDLKTLEKKYNFDGKVMSSKEFVEQAMDNGVEIKEREVNKLDYPSRTRWNRMNGYEQDEYEKRIKAAGKKTVYSINGFEFPKTVVDYAKFYKENGKSKTESEKPSKSEIAIKNKATSLAGAFGYSKTYATKMGSPFNLELAEQTVDEELDWDDGSKKALKEELRRIYSEKKVQKSLFDDFIMDVFEADDEEEIEDAIKADETEYNDYSAEQPELFNSTVMKVREALDRINNQVL